MRQRSHPRARDAAPGAEHSRTSTELSPEIALRVVRERLRVRYRPAQQRLPTERVLAHVVCNTRTRRRRLLLLSGSIGAQERVERDLQTELQLQELERLQVHAHDVRIGEVAQVVWLELTQKAL